MAAGKTGQAEHANQHEFQLSWSSAPQCDTACDPRPRTPDSPPRAAVESHATPPGGRNVAEQSQSGMDPQTVWSGASGTELPLREPSSLSEGFGLAYVWLGFDLL